MPGLTLQSPLTNAGDASLLCDAPTQNTDGTPLTDLSHYEFHYGCDQSGLYDSVVTGGVAACDGFVIDNLPDVGTCYFAAKAVNLSGTASAFSNEASKLMGVELPGVISALVVDYQESTGCTDCLDLSGLVPMGGDVDNDVTLLSDGVRLNNNTWQVTPNTFTITASTVLEFDFDASGAAEWVGIGFVTRTHILVLGEVFKLHGSTPEPNGLQISGFENGPGQYSIPVGQHYTGTRQLAFINDHDNGTGSSATFRNVRIIE